LSAAIDVASWFLPAGETVAIEQGHATEDPVIYRSKGYPLIQTQKWEMAILVNQGSASAAEIVAGALAESGKAVLVGEQTFGKGSVQELIPLNKNSAIKLTTAKWLTPGGLSISKNGLTPDHVIEVDEEAATEGEDEVLEAALDLLNS
jgi:carboxyl-terminal processing protease